MAPKKKSGFLTFVFSLMPGVGHYYLGLMNRGLQFMVAFFGVIAVGSFLDAPSIALFLPVIWFYALFDALQMGSMLSAGEPVEDIPPVPWDMIKVKDIWIGWGLIILGVYLVMQRILPPLLPWLSYNGYTQTAFVAVLLILGGIKILMPGKERNE